MKSSKLNSFKVANWLIDRFDADERTITQLQLNKLAFIAHGWSLAVTETPLVTEPFLAWKYGPVLGSLYEEFQRFGAAPITQPAWFYDADEDVCEPRFSMSQTFEQSALEFVYGRYGSLDAGSLVELTHKPGTPWHIVTNGGQNIGSNKPIPNEQIKDYYRSLM